MRKIVVFASLLAAPAGPALEATATKQAPQRDPRVNRIHQFFKSKGCPLSKLAEDFVREADAHKLDWRLLPSISYIESSGGKRFQNNNVFGWDSGRAKFESVRAGIHAVAESLRNSPLYRNKTTDQVLRTYNPFPGYLQRVKSVMRALGPARHPILASLD